MKIHKKRFGRLPSYIIWLILSVILIGSIGIWSYLFFTNDNYRIQSVRYTLENIKQYNNIDTYTKITSYLSGESLRYRSLLWYGDIIDAVQQTIPYIDTLSFVAQWPSTVRVVINFFDPLIILQYQDKKRAVYSGWYAIPLFSWNTLGMGSKYIRLPVYLSGTDVLSGIFFTTPFEKVYYDRISLDPYIMSWWFITYIPWGEKYVLVNGDYRYYFNAKKDIESQIRTLLDLKKYYKDFNRLKQIDIGSLSYPIVQ